MLYNISLSIEYNTVKYNMIKCATNEIMDRWIVCRALTLTLTWMIVTYCNVIAVVIAVLMTYYCVEYHSINN